MISQEEMMIKTFLSKLKFIRKQTEWDQRKLASALDITQSYLSRLFAGKHRPNIVVWEKVKRLHEKLETKLNRETK